MIGLFRGKTNINVVILESIRCFCLLLAKRHHPCIVYHLSFLGSGLNHLMTSTSNQGLGSTWDEGLGHFLNQLRFVLENLPVWV